MSHILKKVLVSMGQESNNIATALLAALCLVENSSLVRHPLQTKGLAHENYTSTSYRYLARWLGGDGGGEVLGRA